MRQARNDVRQGHQGTPAGSQANPAQHVNWQAPNPPQGGQASNNAQARGSSQNNGNHTGGQQGRGNARRG
jgi:hypothetical protein